MAGYPQAQIPIPEEVKEEMEEVIESIKGFFESMGVSPKVSELEQDEDGAVYVSIDFDERVELTEEQFDDFVTLLKDGLGFCSMNGAENQIASYIEFKEWLVYDEYRKCDPSYDVWVYLKYYEAQMKGKVTIYLDGLSVAMNTRHYEEEQGEEKNEE